LWDKGKKDVEMLDLDRAFIFDGRYFPERQEAV
jgi:hypothetical protein